MHPVLSCPEPGAVKSLGAAQYRIPQGGRGQSWLLRPPAPHGPLERLRCSIFTALHDTPPHTSFSATLPHAHARRAPAPDSPPDLQESTIHPWACELHPFLESRGATGFQNCQGEWKPWVSGDFRRAPGSRDSLVLSLSLLEPFLGTWVGTAQPRQTPMPCPRVPDPLCLDCRVTLLLRPPSTFTYPSIFQLCIFTLPKRQVSKYC